MTPFEDMLIDLVQVAESPLYSTYRWLGRELGRDVQISGFLHLVDHLVHNQSLCLWLVDLDSQERKRLRRVPPELERRYAAEADLDPAFDPFGLSLTVGPTANVDEEPEWEADFDFGDGRFRLLASDRREAESIEQLEVLFPDLEFLEEERTNVGGRAQIVGAITEKSARA
jgi:hypothetical protein